MTANATDSLEPTSPEEGGGEGFLDQLFVGRFRPELLEPYPLAVSERPAVLRYRQQLERVLREEVDPSEIDRTGKYPDRLLRRLVDVGAFGMRIPCEYGGLGLTHAEYGRVMELLAGLDGNVAALLAAHQSVGVPPALLLFGNEAQRRAFLPRCATGAVSALALHEQSVGADPTRLQTGAEAARHGDCFILNGERLWSTNGTIAELMLVVARDPVRDQVNAFVVETGWEGVEVEHRSQFMGLRALPNGVVSFRNVRVPQENLVGGEGDGMRIAQRTLQEARLPLAAGAAGVAASCVEMVRKWSKARVQWGSPYGQHEAVAHLNGRILGHAFALEAVAQMLAGLLDRPGGVARLEAAAARAWNEHAGQELLTDTVRVRGGRGFETETSLAARGEPAISVERRFRDAPVHGILDGTNELPHLLLGRTALQLHRAAAGGLFDRRAGLGARLKALPRALWFYAWWYPTRWWGGLLGRRARRFGALAEHMRWADAAARRLGRAVFHGLLVHRTRVERRQAFLIRLADVAVEIFVLTAAVLRAHAMVGAASPHAQSAVELADLVAREARCRIERTFTQLWSGLDRPRGRLGRALLTDRFAWLEQGTMPLDVTEEELAPPAVQEILRERERRHAG